jgi:hypothetical protein
MHMVSVFIRMKPSTVLLRAIWGLVVVTFMINDKLYFCNAIFAVRWSLFVCCIILLRAVWGLVVVTFMINDTFYFCNAMGTGRLGEILRFRKFQGRSADLLRSENRPSASAPPGTFPARGGALWRCPTRSWGIVKSAVQYFGFKFKRPGMAALPTVQ